MAYQIHDIVYITVVDSAYNHLLTYHMIILDITQFDRLN
jgi:hypothetical protein